MIRNRLYYAIKPLIPWSVRMGVRRRLAAQKRRECADVWPIKAGSENPPAGWPGWPEGKQFALVLTHDVEGRKGLEKVHRLMELEKSLGFRSGFNLIPEGEYEVPVELRNSLTDGGFEVGVHDLKHDGRLFLSREDFARNAARINHYLKSWGAVGFRSGFMLHNLKWLHDLNLTYDCSTFDTDPFEPQPEGENTIFPFWIDAPTDKSTASQQPMALPAGSGSACSRRGGYVELPYTLPQDSTLFLLLGETSPEIWTRKLDWIAQHGGMALVGVHPDYIRFKGEPASPRTYPVEHYTQFLEYAKARFAGRYWQALPKEVAEYVDRHERQTRINGSTQAGPPGSSRNHKPKIWIDLDNTPHVPFFEPIIEELRHRGYPLAVTARDAFQVCELADKKQLSYIRVGKHSGKNRLRKGFGLAYRALQLAPVILGEKPVLGISHGSRSQLLLGNCLRIPTVLIEDYEYCRFPFMMRPNWVLAPSVIPDQMLASKNEILKYPGIKEDVYAWKLAPDPTVLDTLGIRATHLVVTVRPPATEAHYHNPESERLFEAFMDHANATPNTRLVLLPRNRKQADWIRRRWPQWFDRNQTVIPGTALDGLNLIWHSDLLVSGGGTMNREAAALGVPVYSIFRGKIGAVDQQLAAEGRLLLIESVEQVRHQIKLEKRPAKALGEVTSRHTLEHIVDAIEDLAVRVSRS
jgi:predicted glycosyltransferase